MTEANDTLSITGPGTNTLLDDNGDDAISGRSFRPDPGSQTRRAQGQSRKAVVQVVESAYVRTQHARSRTIARELAAELMLDYGKDSLTGISNWYGGQEP